MVRNYNNLLATLNNVKINKILLAIFSPVIFIRETRLLSAASPKKARTKREESADEVVVN